MNSQQCVLLVLFLSFFVCVLICTLAFIILFQEPEDLFETISQAMLNAVDRDAVSGMGVIVHVM